MGIIQGMVGVIVILGYLLVESRGIIFSETDQRPVYGHYGRSGRRGGNIFFWGSGYRGGK
ncbi:MAG: hypothetical protein KTR25_00740 [Myxococcales bacterium]|nr:hypothetical protein [Myxococcales bacterium]